MNEMEVITKNIEHLMHAKHRATADRLVALGRRVPLILEKLRTGGEQSIEEDLKQLEDAADSLVKDIYEAYYTLPEMKAVEERIESIRIVLAAIVLRSWRATMKGKV